MIAVPPVLTLHIAAGSIAILCGAAALILRKGGRGHRMAGQIFAVSMQAMAGLGIMLALTMPPAKGAAPPQASIVVATLTIYLVATGWLAMRPDRRFDRPGMLAAFAIAAVLMILGARALMLHLLAVPYFVFAAIALFAGVQDIRFVRRGGQGRAARHLWRMCLALFFATAFFFIGQQKVMPASWHGSPLLFAAGAAPLAVMAYWLRRVRRPTKEKGPAAQP